MALPCGGDAYHPETAAKGFGGAPILEVLVLGKFATRAMRGNELYYQFAQFVLTIAVVCSNWYQYLLY